VGGSATYLKKEQASSTPEPFQVVTPSAFSRDAVCTSPYTLNTPHMVHVTFQVVSTWKLRTRANKAGVNNLSLQLKREIQEVKNESLNSYLRELTNQKETGCSIWRATKRMRSPVVHISPTRKEDGS
jgi:hypothetical protein